MKKCFFSVNGAASLKLLIQTIGLCLNNTKSKDKNLSYLEGWLSIGLNVILFALKYWAGIVSGSIAIIADAWHTLSDSLSSIFVLIGARVSEKPPDEHHPFGHGRAELITAILIGMFLAFVAYEFGRESISNLMQHQMANFGPAAIIVTIISIIIKEGMAQFAFWAFRQTGYRSLRADAWHHRTDALSSLIILLGILLGRTIWWVDGLLGLFVGLMISYAAVNIIRDAVDPLMGRIADAKMLKQINELCNRNSNDFLRAHHFHIHEYGNHVEITFHLVFPAQYTLQQAHNLANQIEVDIRNTYNIEATIHMEPEGEEKDFHPENQSFY